MSAVHSDDPLFKAIAGLPAVEPTVQHADRVRGRARAALCQPDVAWPSAFEPATVGVICALYAWQVARIAIRMPLP